MVLKRHVPSAGLFRCCSIESEIFIIDEVLADRAIADYAKSKGTATRIIPTVVDTDTFTAVRRMPNDMLVLVCHWVRAVERPKR